MKETNERSKPEKTEFSKLLTQFHLRYQIELGRKVNIQELAEIIGLSDTLLSSWMKTNQNRLPGGSSVIRLINFFVDYFGEEAFCCMMLWDGKDPKS